MAAPVQPSRWLVLAAAVLLLATAAIHGAGYAPVTGAVAAAGVAPGLVNAVSALWLMYSAHLIVLAIVAALASGVAGSRRVILACGLIPAADTILLLRFVGVFAGSIAVAAATVLLVLAGLRQPGRTVSGRAVGSPD
ncbi:MAG TPA: hypothetical protein VMN82_15500 [Thermoanaerobaculia bacterium]|nr:hypothetical protein [Thermoanaerobaculia bacterium]